jgi:hypothetical protein
VIDGALPLGNRRADHIDLGGHERGGHVRLAVQPGDVVHRVTRQNLVPNREFQREPQHHPGLLGAVVGELGELLDELVAPGHSDLPQGEVVEGG